MKPLKNKLRKPLVTAAAAVGTSTLVVSAVVMAARMIGAPSSNPWDYTMYASDSGAAALKSSADSLKIDGDVRTAGSAVFGDGKTEISGNLVAGGEVQYGKDALRAGKITENAAALSVNSVFSDVFREATSGQQMLYAESFSDSSLTVDQPVIGENELTLRIHRNSLSAGTVQGEETPSYKFGAFGADFMTDVYNRPDEWSKVFPFLFSGDAPEKDLAALGESSAFLPVDPEKNTDGWTNADRLPENVFGNHLSASDVPEYISKIKEDNPVFDICSDPLENVKIEAAYSRSTINPEEAADAKQITVTGGNIALDGTYENLEEIRFSTWGGVQLHGSYPNLKYIYMPTWGNINLAGDFPALECVYLNGGQILLGTGSEGFSASHATVLAENGTVILYTAEDVALDDCQVLSLNNIIIRGSGAASDASSFRAENSLFATRGAIAFEDMHDINTAAFGDLPVYYSGAPISVVKSDIECLQGCFLSRTGAMVFSESNIGTLRGFWFAPDGINSYALNSTAYTYINTFNYNILPEINSLNTQQTGSWKKGTVEALAEARFPAALAGTVTDIDGFLADSISIRNDDGEYEQVYSYKGAAANAGILTLDSALISEGNLNITADVLKGGNTDRSLIVSRSGDVTLEIGSMIDWTGIIFAPGGKVTVNGSGTLHGRIFAKEIELDAEALTVVDGGFDMAARGFTKPAETVVTTAPVTTGPKPVTTSGPKPVTTTDTTATTAKPVTTPATTSSVPETTTTAVKTAPAYTEAQYEYDKLGRLVKVVYDEKNYIEYTYDANGNITSVKKTTNGITKE